MKFMLYCIFRDSPPLLTESVVGIDEEPVAVVCANGLCVAVSRASLSGLTPDVARALAYQRVVEAFHRNHTVIPLRYGSVQEEETRIVRLLENSGPRLKLLLNELHGCVEMGVRILLAPPPETEAQEGNGREGASERLKPGDHAGEPDMDPRPRAGPSGAGLMYLEKRRAYYGLDKLDMRKKAAMAQRCLDAFAGLYVKLKREEIEPEPGRVGLGLSSSSAHRSLLSLYFLVPRTSIELFRQAFRNLSSKETDGFLLSGPWAPYNFVTELFEDSKRDSTSSLLDH